MKKTLALTGAALVAATPELVVLGVSTVVLVAGTFGTLVLLSSIGNIWDARKARKLTERKLHEEITSR